MESALKEGGHFHGSLIGFDIGDRLAGGDGVTFFDDPFGEGSLGHGVT